MLNWLMKLLGWSIQDTKHGFNGDVDFRWFNRFKIESHTNPEHTAPDPDTWKENRVEVAHEIPEGVYRWKFKISDMQWPEHEHYIILSQIWNKKHTGVAHIVGQRKGDKLQISLDTKQSDKVSTPFYTFININEDIEVDLLLKNDSIFGFICEKAVTWGQKYEFSAPEIQNHVKYGAYWSQQIPYITSSKLKAKFKI